MTILAKIINVLSTQIRKDNVKLPNKEVSHPTIHDNNQAINNGVINEKHNSSLRSKSKSRSIG